MRDPARFTSHPLWLRVRRKIERLLARHGFELARIAPDFAGGYRENPRLSPLKLSEYIARADDAGKGKASLDRFREFESPEALVLNKAVARFIGSARSIVNFRSETAAFERFVALDPSLELVANMRDDIFAAWASSAAPHRNVSYCSGGASRLLDAHGRFDLALAIDIIDRERDFSGLLRDLARLSDRVVVTASNKARDHESLVSPQPADPRRIREWTAGEFYWVLKGHFDQVDLYGLPDPVVPHAVAVGPLSKLSPLIAICRSS